ncbi:hypothetical protein HanXRQr2_Chr09g0383521 [Helianthus annuus]|uniref:Uncharacterized protein n=1 Tax=Helianthus annuus TaxID=4232 RepID=A0A9K3N7S4_HELAN|nr:hypothetical protein HanXRQr2_Chr09g0383521 [Helianthus annuus]KAJ0892742.1 hypothetical protein HanPSC8_Chr09g0369601 [Helianthus annuus]
MKRFSQYFSLSKLLFWPLWFSQLNLLKIINTLARRRINSPLDSSRPTQEPEGREHKMISD